MRRSPQNAHDRSRKDLQQKQSLVVRYSEAITAKCSRQKPQGLAAKAIVSFSLGRRSPQKTHAQRKQSLVVRYSEAVTAKCSRQKPQGFAAKASFALVDYNWSDTDRHTNTALDPAKPFSLKPRITGIFDPTNKSCCKVPLRYGRHRASHYECTEIFALPTRNENFATKAAKTDLVLYWWHLYY